MLKTARQTTFFVVEGPSVRLCLSVADTADSASCTRPRPLAERSSGI